MSEQFTTPGTGNDAEPGQTQQPYQQAYQPPPMNPGTERQLVCAAHWSAIVSAVAVGLTFLGPLIVLLGWGNRSPEVRRHAVDALNFQITTWIITGVLIVVGLLTLIFIIGVFILIAAGFVWLAALVVHVVAAIKVANGEDFRYPWTLHLIK